MLTWEDDVEVHALRKRGWTISAIARHTGRDRKTVRNYLTGERQAGGAGPARPGSVRAVRRLRHRPAGRGPAPVGPHPVRRAGGAGVRPVVSEPDPQHPGPESAPGLRGVPHAPPNGRTRSSRIRRVMKPNGTGWNCPIRPTRGGGARRRICWSARWRIPGKWRAALSPSRISRTWSPALDRVDPRPGWGDAGCGGSTGWPRSATPAVGPGDRHRSPGSPSTTGCRWRSARRGAATARAWWRRSTTPPRNAGGAPWPTR